MLSTRGEGEPANPQEGQEFNREKCNSKARTAALEHRPEPDGIEENRQADHSSSEEHPARTRAAARGGEKDAEDDESPVPPLEAAKIRRRAHLPRSGGAR